MPISSPTRATDSSTPQFETLPESLVAATKFELRKWLPILGYAVIVGVVGGVAAILFKLFVDFFMWLSFDVIIGSRIFELGNLNFGFVVLPAIGGLVAGLLIDKYSPEAYGTGIPEVMESIIKHKGKIRKRVGLIKLFGSSITIGTGGSAGREGPIAQIGSAFGSMLGRSAHLDASRRRLLVVCGLAAGVAGTFQAPFSGAIFAMEVMVETIYVFDAIPIFISSAIGASISRLYHGTSFVFVSSFSGISIPEVFLLLAFGVLFGLFAVGWIKSFYGIQKGFDHVPIPQKFKPMLGGAIAGAIAMFFPFMGIAGVGYEGIDATLAGEFAVGTLLVLGLAKILATGSTIGAGGSGGMFAPTLVIGCFLGGAVGLLFSAIAPDLVPQPLLYCYIGMGALFAGASQCPLNIITMIPEMTGNLTLLLPLMVACMTSFLIFRILMKDQNMYTIKLARRGLHIRMRATRSLEGVKVAEIMSQDVHCVPPSMPARDFEQFVQTTHHHRYPIIANNWEVLGMATTTALLSLPLNARDSTTVAEFASHDFGIIDPEDSAQQALRLMTHQGVQDLLVIHSEAGNELQGIVTYADIVKAYQILYPKDFRHKKSKIT